MATFEPVASDSATERFRNQCGACCRSHQRASNEVSRSGKLPQRVRIHPRNAHSEPARECVSLGFGRSQGVRQQALRHSVIQVRAISRLSLVVEQSDRRSIHFPTSFRPREGSPPSLHALHALHGVQQYRPTSPNEVYRVVGEVPRADLAKADSAGVGATRSGAPVERTIGHALGYVSGPDAPIISLCIIVIAGAETPEIRAEDGLAFAGL